MESAGVHLNMGIVDKCCVAGKSGVELFGSVFLAVCLVVRNRCNISKGKEILLFPLIKASVELCPLACADVVLNFLLKLRQTQKSRLFSEIRENMLHVFYLIFNLLNI